MSHELINLTQYGPPPDMRKRIYLECVADIKNKNASATGSIIVLWALLRMYPMKFKRIIQLTGGFRKTSSDNWR